MRLTIAYSKIKKRNLVLINNDTHQRETVSERPIRPPLKVLLILGTPYLRPCAGPNRGHPCLGLAAIFAGMLYNVQIIQKSSTRNIMHVGIIVLELPASYSGSLINEMD